MEGLASSSAQLQGLPQIHTDNTRERGFNGPIEESVERPYKARLSKRNLRAFMKLEKMRRQSRGSLSGHRATEPKSSCSRSEAVETKSSSGIASSTGPDFAFLAFENGVLDPDSSKPPMHLNQLEERLDRARDTPSPSESEYRTFAHKMRTAPNKRTVLLETSHLLKGYGAVNPKYSKAYNCILSAFPKNVGFNDGISPAQPDVVEGFEIEEFSPFPVRQQLSGAAVPTFNTHAITLPHFAGEWKRPGEDMIEAQTQAAYGGAFMVYGRNHARAFLRSPDPEGQAYVHTFTTDGTVLRTFAHYSSQSLGQVKYHQFPTSSSFLISTYEDFKMGRRRLRNAQDVAKENSEALRDELKNEWSASQHDIYDDNNDRDDGENEPSTRLLPNRHAAFAKDQDADELLLQVSTPTPHPQ